MSLVADTWPATYADRTRRGSVDSVRRLLFAPSWIARHLLALAMVALFIRMGIWQLTKGESAQGSLQNLFYGVEWPIFAAFVVYWWYKMIREELSPTDDSGPQWGAGGRIAPEAPWRPELDGPRMLTAASDSPEEDEEVDAYNRYLTSLYERDVLREALKQIDPKQIESKLNPKQINGAR
ncbi:hypothetical protein ND748_19910 [Frankia sp. AiPs1]|nr:hypothetical protein [Frankia sp. AiPs1]MCM3923925.1 hypothetical protein [Frankia sp. AiPs1]